MDTNAAVTLEVNLSRFDTVMSRYVTELNLVPADVLDSQARLLMRELADGAAPRNRSVMEKRIESDVAKVYAPSPKQMLPVAHRQGHGFVWLLAGPKFLVGARPHNVHLQDSLSDMQKLFHKTKAAHVIKGNKYLEMERRGKQHVNELNRIVVRRGVYQEFVRWLKKRGGILGGSWATGWNSVRTAGRPPAAFKMRHVLDGTARGSFINAIDSPESPSFTIINRAARVESETSLTMVSGVLRHRAEAMLVDIKNQLRGAYNRAGWSHGN